MLGQSYESFHTLKQAKVATLFWVAGRKIAKKDLADTYINGMLFWVVRYLLAD